MKTIGMHRFFKQGILLGVSFFLLLVFAKASAGETAGTIKTMQGTVNIERGEQKLNAVVGDTVMTEDKILTGADSSVGITLHDNTLISAGPNSTLLLNRFAFDSSTHAGTIEATIKRGTLSVVSGKIAKSSPENITFHAPSVTLGIRGTEFIINAGQGEE